jgi:glutamate---cysteine ligase / carboxylate-amine ligase
VIEAHFGESGVLSLGVEEELMILDARTLLPVDGVETLVREAEGLELPGRLKTELHASVVELNTGVCGSVEEAVAALAELRRAAAAIAERHGLAVAGAGAHPSVAPEALPIAQEERYLEMVRYAGPSARRQGVNGLHVHVGMPSAEACFHVLESLVPWLPLVLALSANSPYLAGVENGMLSNRAQLLAELPRSGAPPAFRSYEDWEAWVERLVRLGVTGDYTRLWWDVRPHPRFGTLEVRMPDQPTALARTGALVALLQALAATLLRAPAAPADPGRRGDYLQNRWAAARFGLDAELIHPDGQSALSAHDLATEALELVRPAAAELGSEALLAFSEPEAARQLEVGRAEGLEAVCADLVARSVA